MSILDALTWVISGGGAAIGGFEIVEHVPWFSTLPADWKRYVAFALTGLLAVVAWVAITAIGNAAWPVDWRAWVSQLFSVAAAAILAGQGIHAAAKLRKV
jgi:hypothetical protein